MPRTKAPRVVPCSLIASIESVEQSYYISQYPDHRPPVGDEAIFDIVARIEQISPSLKQHVGREFEVSLMCARSFDGDEPTPTADKPFLSSILFRKSQCSALAYLPAEAFWELPSMIRTEAVTHLQAHFSAPYRGTGELFSLFFGKQSKMMPV